MPIARPRPSPAASAVCSRRFFATDSPTLARRLLGQTLVRVLDDGTRLAGIIVETEAYLGAPDRASHAFRGRRTRRTEPMFGPPGTSYVYFTYGMHDCFNVACGPRGVPWAVLIRALEPIEGLETMRALRVSARRTPATLRDVDLCSGPGKLCRALAIDRHFTGIDLCSDRRLFVARTRRRPLDEEQVGNSPRIGVAFAGDWAAKPLRWFMKGNPNVSG